MDKDTYRALQCRKEQTNLLILSLDTRIRKLEATVKFLEKQLKGLKHESSRNGQQ